MWVPAVVSAGARQCDAFEAIRDRTPAPHCGGTMQFLNGCVILLEFCTSCDEYTAGVALPPPASTQHPHPTYATLCLRQYHLHPGDARTNDSFAKQTTRTYMHAPLFKLLLAYKLFQDLMAASVPSRRRFTHYVLRDSVKKHFVSGSSFPLVNQNIPSNRTSSRLSK